MRLQAEIAPHDIGVLRILAAENGGFPPHKRGCRYVRVERILLLRARPQFIGPGVRACAA